MKLIFTILLNLLGSIAFAQTDNWDNYVVSVNEKPVSVVVNLGLRDLAPAKERPYAIILRLKYPDVDEKGFPTVEMADDLNKLESMLEASLQKSNGAWYAGRFTQRGLREFYFYTLDTVDYFKSCAAVLVQFPKFPWLVKAVYDKAWSNYFEVLYPQNEEKEKLENRRTIDELVKKGDVSSRQRPIDHTLFFKSDWHRKQFLKAIEEPGFKVIEMPVEKSNNTEQGFKMVLRRDDRPELQTMNTLTIYLSQLATKNGGRYSGWSTFVVKG
jgi:uncharacterized protein (TIGR01619 family)